MPVGDWSTTDVTEGCLSTLGQMPDPRSRWMNDDDEEQHGNSDVDNGSNKFKAKTFRHKFYIDCFSKFLWNSHPEIPCLSNVHQILQNLTRNI